MYTYERFGAITLPPYNRRSDQDPAPPQATVVATIAGAFDAWGADRAPQKFPQALSLDCVLSEDTAAAMRTAIDALRAAVGTRAALYRRADDDLTLQICTARLVAMDYQRQPGNLRQQRLKLQFQQLGPWLGKRAEDWTLDDGEVLDDGLYFDTSAIDLSAGGEITVTVGGNLPLTNGILIVTVDTATTVALDITLTVAAQGIDWSLSGTYADGDVITIDCGARSVVKNTTDAYADFTLNAGHTNEHWLALAPGANVVDVIIVTVPASGITLALTYAEQWA